MSTTWCSANWPASLDLVIQPKNGQDNSLSAIETFDAEQRPIAVSYAFDNELLPQRWAKMAIAQKDLEESEYTLVSRAVAPPPVLLLGTALPPVVHS